MTATAHLLVGGAFASAIPNPALGICLSFISHPLLDLIPHWDEGWGWRKKTKVRLFVESSLDVLLGATAAYFLFGQNVALPYFVACLIASIFSDLMEVPYLIFNMKIPPFIWFYQLQHNMQGKVKLPWGILTQLATVIIIVLVLQTVPR